jgi:hypothetical protein
MSWVMMIRFRMNQLARDAADSMKAGYKCLWKNNDFTQERREVIKK